MSGRCRSTSWRQRARCRSQLLGLIGRAIPGEPISRVVVDRAKRRFRIARIAIEAGGIGAAIGAAELE